jgi:hypothetical protein
MLARLVGAGGVGIDARNARGNTCVHIATSINRYDALRWLLGADVERVNRVRQTALFYACDIDAGQCIYLLLAAGADVHARNRARQTPCHAAAEALRADLVCALVAAGADLHAEDIHGRMPRDLAAVDRRRSRSGAPSHRHRAARAGARPRIASLHRSAAARPRRPADVRSSAAPVASAIPFHQWWKIATAVKHFRDERRRPTTKRTTEHNDEWCNSSLGSCCGAQGRGDGATEERSVTTAATTTDAFAWSQCVGQRQTRRIAAANASVSFGDAQQQSATRQKGARQRERSQKRRRKRRRRRRRRRSDRSRH